MDISKHTDAYKLFSILLKEERLSARVRAKKKTREIILGLKEKGMNVEQMLKDLEGISC